VLKRGRRGKVLTLSQKRLVRRLLRPEKRRMERRIRVMRLTMMETKVGRDRFAAMVAV
jgi:hypothetical protein